MNKLIFIISTLFSLSIFAQECKYLGLDKEFENGDVAYIFGDNVRLRTSPSSESETLKLLKIASKITILEKTNNKNNFKGIQTPWYKIKYNDQTGYILGGLISLTQIKKNNIKCLVNLEKINSELYITVRVIPKFHSTYLENKSLHLGDNNGFCLKLFDNKGLKEVSNIISINYLPESCGANSGGYYIFFDNKKLYKTVDLTSRGDIGIWESENLYFPNDSLGIKNRIIYIRRKGEYSDNEPEENVYNWEKSSEVKLKLEWNNDKLTPNPKTFINNNFN
ncbi:SH3 domain-containing protein [Tenacibaculum sp.]|nr:SH3 domain-containing protein [Tenacibaculum sp.]